MATSTHVTALPLWTERVRRAERKRQLPIDGREAVNERGPIDVTETVRSFGVTPVSVAVKVNCWPFARIQNVGRTLQSGWISHIGRRDLKKFR
jgi:hypothetical protein